MQMRSVLIVTYDIIVLLLLMDLKCVKFRTYKWAYWVPWAGRHHNCESQSGTRQARGPPESTRFTIWCVS